MIFLNFPFVGFDRIFGSGTIGQSGYPLVWNMHL